MNMRLDNICRFVRCNLQFFVVFAVITAFFFILQSKFPYFFLQDDNRSQYLAYYVGNYNSILSGEIPFFTFNQFAGMPLMSNGQSGVFFIPAYLCVFLSKVLFGHVFYTIDILSYFLILASAFGTLLFLREMGLKKPAALVGSLLFPLNSFVIFIGNSWIVVIGAAAFFPFMMYFALKLFHAPSVRNCTKLVVCRILLFTMGHMQYFAYSLIIEMVFFLSLCIVAGFSARDSEKGRNKLFSLDYRKVTWYLFAMISTLILALPILLPGLERMSGSVGREAAQSFEDFVSRGTDIGAFFNGMLSPFDFNGFLEYSSFCGRVTLVLCALCAILSLYMAVRKKKNPYSIYLIPSLVAAAFCFLWQTNLIAEIMHQVPLINRFRWHYKLQLLFFFFPTVFAATGFSLLLTIMKDRLAGFPDKRQRIVSGIAACLLITASTSEFIRVYAYTYDKPLSVRTWEDDLPYEEPLAWLINDGRYVSVGFRFSENKMLHTMGFALAQMYGLYNIGGYEMLLPERNADPSLGLNIASFYNDLAYEKSEISDLDHFRSWSVSYYVVNNEYVDIYGPLPYFTEFYKDDKRTVFHDAGALPMVFRGDTRESLDFKVGVNRIDANVSLDKDVHIYFNVVHNDRFRCYADNSEISTKRTGDGKIEVLIPAGTSHLSLRYVEPTFWAGLWIAVAFLVFCLVFYRHAHVEAKKGAGEVRLILTLRRSAHRVSKKR